MFDSLLNILVDITEENISALFNIAQSQFQPFQYLLLVRHWTEPCVAMRHPHHKANPSIWCPTYPYGDQVKTVRSQLTDA